MQFLLLLAIAASGVSFASGYDKFLHPTTAPEPKASCNSVPKTNTGRLKEALFCGYDPGVRPVVHHSNQTTVKLAAFPTNIGWIMEEKNQIWMSFWIYMQWKDDLLTWNASDYEGLDEFYTEGAKIWVPDIFVSDPPQSQINKQMSCGIRSNGFVDCTMNPSMTARCNIDLTYFPFDRHSCKLVFRPRSYKGPVLNLDFINTEGTDPFKFYRSHGTWNMVSLKTNRNVSVLYNEVYTIDMEYTFVIQRRSSTYNVTYATPALVMMMMVLSVFWLEVQCSARIILPSLAVLSHMIIIRWLMDAIRSNFEHLPVIIVLFRDSLFLTGLALVWSVAARTLCASPSSPYWLYMASTTLNNSQLVKLLLPQDIFVKSGASGDEDESSLVVHRDCVEQQWRILTILCDRLLFGLFTLAYIYFFMRLTP